MWRTNLGELLSGPARALLEQLGVTSRVVRKLEDSILAECYGRSCSYFRENGEIFNRSHEIRLGFSSRFTSDQTKFLRYFLPLLKKAIPGLRLYAYGSKFLADVPGPEHLLPFVEWRGIAGMLTYDAANLVGKDKLDIFCDLDWGNSQARTDIAIANPAATRLLWSVPNGRLRVAISNRYWIDETLALKEPKWQTVPATAKLGMAVWKDHQGFDLLAGEFKELLDHCLKIAKELNIYPHCTKGDTAPPIGKIDRAKKQKTLVSSDEDPSHRSHVLDRWLGDVRKLGFSFNTALQAAELRIAVITPYTHDQIDKLEGSHRSVSEQTFPARHFFIGQGLRCEAVDQWDVEHVVLPEDPQDLGLAAIAATAKIALAQGYNAIAFIMPGQRYRANHLRDLALASTRERSDLTMSRAALVGTHGRIFAEHINMGNIPVHHDNFISTFLITGRALDLMPIWAAVPQPARYFATGIFRSALRARGLRQYMIANASVEVVANEAFTFKKFSDFMPENALPIDFKERALLEPKGSMTEWLSLLVATNSNIDLPSVQFGVLFDAEKYLSEGGPTPKVNIDLSWVKVNSGLEVNPISASSESTTFPLWPEDQASCESWTSQISQQKNVGEVVTVRFLTHHYSAGPLRTTGGCIYSSAGLIASFMEQGWLLDSWQSLGSSKDGKIVDYIFSLKYKSRQDSLQKELAA